MLRPRALAARVMKRLLGSDKETAAEHAPPSGPRRPSGSAGQRVAAVERTQFELEGGSSAPGAARALVRKQLSGVLGPRQLDDALVLVSELVMNSVLHAGAGAGEPLSVDLAIAPERVRIEVCDKGPGFEPPTSPRTPGASGGLGVLLLHRMAKSWGAIPEEGHSCVWFELEREAAPGISS